LKHTAFFHGTKAVFLRNIKIIYQYKSGMILDTLANGVAFLLFFYVASLLPDGSIVFRGNPVSSISYILLGMLCINISTKVLTKSLGSFISEMRQGTFEYISLQPFGLKRYFLAEILFELVYALIMSFVCYGPIVLIYAVFQGIKLSLVSTFSLFLLLAVYILFFFPLALFVATLTLLVKRAKELTYLVMGILQFLSGALFPITFFPTWLQYIAKLSPLTQFVSSLRLIVFGHATIFTYDVWIALLVLSSCALFLYFVFSVIFQRVFKKLRYRGDFAIY
ncbi:MAG: ABC transporter permease, partial [Candidatus Heimdallarchaeaceae archaeon]